MKKLYESVSDMIFPGIVCTAVTSIFIGTALFGRIGDRMAVESENFSHMADTQALEAVCKRKAPVIQCAEKRVWRPGESILISRLYSAVDEEGKNLQCVVSDIKNQNGDSVMDCFQESTGQAVFVQRGVYTFYLKTMDKERKISEETMVILVDDR